MAMWFITLFIAVFYLIGFGIVGYGLASMRRSVKAASWPVADGTIEECRLVSQSEGDGGVTHEVKVRYRYEVAGVAYSNDKLAFGYSANSASKGSKEIHRRLQAAETVEVRYDPADPQSAVLSYGVHRSIQFVLVFGFTWLAFIVGFSIILWLSSRGDTVMLENLVTH